MRNRQDAERRAIDVADELRYDVTFLETAFRELRREVGELRARVRELEHQLDDLSAPPPVRAIRARNKRKPHA